MDNNLDSEFFSSVNLLKKELILLGVDDYISTTNHYVICQSLLGVAWQLVQFIHCNSVASTEATFSQEREYKLRDELQSTQTQLQQYKGKLEDKENQIKSLELTTRNLQSCSQKWQDNTHSLKVKMKQVENKLERCHTFYKNELSTQAAECEKLRDHLRRKLGLARRTTSADSLADSIERVSIIGNDTRQIREENKLHAIQQTVISLTTSNQILVEENLLMRDTFARLHRQLDAARQYGLEVLENLSIDHHPGQPDDYVYPYSIFNLPVSTVMEKLRRLGEAQTEEIINIFSVIQKSFHKKS